MLRIARVVAPMLLLAGAAAAAPALKPLAVIEAEVVRAGDIFEGAGEKAEAVLAPAPRPGRQAVYDADWLAAAAERIGLDWRPASRFDHVTVERAATAIGAGQIEDALRPEIAALLARQGVAKRVDLVLDNRAAKLYAAPGSLPEIEIRELSLDPGRERFAAVVAAAGMRESLRVGGRVFEVTEIPVLTRRLGAGEVVAAEDIEMRRLRADQVDRGVVTTPEALIGMTPRRPIAEGAPVREGDLRLPIVVAKGALVTMVLETPFMQLTAQGKAVEDGARGQAIKVMNTQSKTTVDAVVDGPARVVVRAASAAVATR